MGNLGSLRIGHGPSPGRSGPQTALMKPALQRPFARQRFRPLPPENNPNQAGSPGWMLPTQRQSLLLNFVVDVRRGSRAVTIARGQGGVALMLETAYKMSDSARCEAQSVGDRHHVLAALMALPDGLPDRRGERTWHGRPSERGMPP